MNNCWENVRPDVRLCIIEDVFRRAVFDKRIENERMKGVLRAGLQFAVRERSRAAEPELDIAFRVEYTRAVKRVYSLFSTRGIVTALDKDGSQSCMR